MAQWTATIESPDGTKMIWRDLTPDQVQTARFALGFMSSSLERNVNGEQHRPVMHGRRIVCNCGDFNCASLDGIDLAVRNPSLNTY